MSLPGEKKQELHRVALERREALGQACVGPWGERIQHRALRHPRYRGANSVALYSPIGNEVPTQRIREHALAAGRPSFYPKLGNRTGRLVRIDSANDLRPGRHGMLEPVGDSCLSDADSVGLVVFVPALLLDRKGNRIGRGGGWYDRVLAALGNDVTCIALAYEFQLVEEVPTEKWDRPMDLIITQSRVVRCEREC